MVGAKTALYSRENAMSVAMSVAFQLSQPTWLWYTQNPHKAGFVFKVQQTLRPLCPARESGTRHLHIARFYAQSQVWITYI